MLSTILISLMIYWYTPHQETLHWPGTWSAMSSPLWLHKGKWEKEQICIRKPQQGNYCSKHKLDVKMQTVRQKKTAHCRGAQKCQQVFGAVNKQKTEVLHCASCSHFSNYPTFHYLLVGVPPQQKYTPITKWVHLIRTEGICVLNHFNKDFYFKFGRNIVSSL